MLTKTDIKTLEEKFATKNDVVEFKDEILHEIRNVRDDVAILTGYKDQIEDQETRIESVEKHLHIAPAS